MNSNENKPYVGVTGFTSTEEVKRGLDKFHDSGFKMTWDRKYSRSSHWPMMGFLVSYKTLNKRPTENQRYPSIDKIPALLEAAENKVLTTIHYNSREKDLADQISQVFKDIYPNLCSAVQLNVVWPDIGQINLIKKRHPKMKIIFQANKGVLNSPHKKRHHRIKPYLDVVDYVLIDPSGGRGQKIGLEDQLDFFTWLRNTKKIVPGIAGGLKSSNVYEVIQEMKNQTGTLNFCIDAEGGLRDKLGKGFGNDVLNIKKLGDYVRRASGILF